MAHTMHVFRPYVWKDGSEMRPRILPRGLLSLDFSEAVSIFWMNTLYHFLE